MNAIYKIFSIYKKILKTCIYIYSIIRSYYNFNYIKNLIKKQH